MKSSKLPLLFESNRKTCDIASLMASIVGVRNALVVGCQRNDKDNHKE